MLLLPKRFFLTKGIGIHAQPQRAVAEALRDAGMERCNLVRVSGVLPPGCTRMSRDEGLAALTPGMIAFVLQAQSVAQGAGTLATAGIAVACPNDGSQTGYFAALDGTGRDAHDVQQEAEERAAGELLAHWGLETEPNEFVRRGQKQYEYGEQVFGVDSLIASAQGHEAHLNTVVLVMAVFLLE
ncbi:pyruvoyl-dependent arginine decarboxylase [Flaviaesturariibacter amylovorans]|uniref:Pyruvoyl-dependent arginine decarboxylase AaxB n=1 Tax=Flaviaesturariibacter amylovorans TaxID=1084520 RepID=A0ABP8HUM4_9BACT